MTTDTHQDHWLSLSDAASRLNVHPTTLRRWADNGDIPIMITPGGHRRFAAADIDQFAEGRHSLRRASGIEQAWADRALIVTRQEIVTHQDVHWLTSLDEATREQNRIMGRQLMALTLQYISNGADDQLIDEARLIGTQYGRTCQQLNMPLTDALQASMFFRDTMIESALQLSGNVNIRPEANGRLLRRISTVLNAVQLSIAEVYDAVTVQTLRVSTSGR